MNINIRDSLPSLLSRCPSMRTRRDELGAHGAPPPYSRFQERLSTIPTYVSPTQLAIRDVSSPMSRICKVCRKCNLQDIGIMTNFAKRYSYLAAKDVIILASVIISRRRDDHLWTRSSRLDDVMISRWCPRLNRLVVWIHVQLKSAECRCPCMPHVLEPYPRGSSSA